MDPWADGSHRCEANNSLKKCGLVMGTCVGLATLLFVSTSVNSHSVQLVSQAPQTLRVAPPTAVSTQVPQGLPSTFVPPSDFSTSVRAQRDATPIATLGQTSSLHYTPQVATWWFQGLAASLSAVVAGLVTYTWRLNSKSSTVEQTVDVELGTGEWAMCGAKGLSIKDRVRTNERDRMYNKSYKSQVKTYTKRFMAAIEAYENDPSEENQKLVDAELAQVYKICDKCVSKGVLHSNTADRRKARVGRMYSALTSAESDAVAMAAVSSEEYSGPETIAMFATAASKGLSIKDRMRTNERDRMYNKSYKSQVKTYTKRFMAAIEAYENDPSEENQKLVDAELAQVYKICDKCVSKGVLHSNTADRRKARVGRMYSALTSAESDAVAMAAVSSEEYSGPETIAMFATAASKGLSIKDRMRTNERDRMYNKSYKSQVKTYTKRFMAAIEAYENDPSEENQKLVDAELAQVYKICDKCVSKGVLHSNTADRRKARVGRMYSALTSAESDAVAMAAVSSEEYSGPETIAMFATAASKGLSIKDRMRTNERDRMYNKSYKSQVKTYTKRFMAAIEAYENDPSEENQKLVDAELAQVYKICDKCVSKGVLHSNTADRRKARVGRMYSALGSGAEAATEEA